MFIVIVNCENISLSDRESYQLDIMLLLGKFYPFNFGNILPMKYLLCFLYFFFFPGEVVAFTQ